MENTVNENTVQKEKNPSTIRLIIGLVLAVVFGIGSSGIAILFSPETIPLVMMIPFIPVFIMVLYGYSGYLPPMVYITAFGIGTSFTLGPWAALGILAAFAIPGFCMIYVSKKGLPFFQQIRFSMIMQAVSIVFVIVILYSAYGSDLGGMAAQAMRSSFEEIPAESKEAFAEMIASMNSQFGLAIEYTTAEDLFNKLEKIFEQSIKITVPMMMVVCIIVNGAIGPLWGNAIRAKRGDEGVQFVPIRGWRLPPITIIAIIMCYIITMILTLMQRAEIDMLYLLASVCVFFAFSVQASASVLSRMFRAGVKKGQRTLICTLMFILAPSFFQIYGVTSALFGSQGVFMPLIRKRMEKKLDEKDKEDPEE